MLVARYRSNVWKLYAYWFFHSLIFAYVIERLFAQERRLNIEQMVYLEIIYAWLAVFLEVPTGVIADRWSRSKMMVLSAIFIFFEFFVLIYAYDFWMFVLSVVCAAIGGALASGTSNALLYDSLKSTHEESQFVKHLGGIDMLRAASGILASILGGLIAAAMNLTATYVFSLVGTTMAIFLALTLRDPPYHRSAREVALWRHIKEAISFILSERALLFVMAYGTVMGATWIYVDEFWQIYVEKIGVPLSLFWFVGLYSLLAEALGGFSAPLLQKRLSYRFVFSAILLGVVGAMLALSFSHSLYGLIFLFLVTLGYYLARPIILGFIHDRTASERRAIVDSMQALVFRVGTIAVGLPFGYISTKYSIFTGFSFLGILLLLYAIVYLGFSSRLIDSDSR